MIASVTRSAGIASLLVLAACSSLVQGSVSSPFPRVVPSASTQSAVSPVGLDNVATAPSQGGVRAPICQASETCAALDAEQIPLSCVKKVPYTNVLVPVGTSSEVLDKDGDFLCLDTGVVVNGKEVLTCHGKELYSFQLRLTNAACRGASLSTTNGRCDDGYGYDLGQKCCAPLSNASAGSTVVTVSLGACPVPNP